MLGYRGRLKTQGMGVSGQIRLLGPGIAPADGQNDDDEADDDQGAKAGPAAAVEGQNGKEFHKLLD